MTEEPGNSEHLSVEELQRWLDLQSDMESNPQVESHLESCESCSELLESLSPAEEWSLENLRAAGTPDPLKTLPIDRVSDDPRDAGIDDLSQPTHASRWTLLNQLTSGGIGEIWIARDELLGRQVAVKRLKRQTATKPSIQRRFLHEARITAQLNHPGIVDIFDLVENGPRSYYAMSLIHGRTLLEELQQFHRSRRSSRFHVRAKLTELLRHWISVTRTIAFAHAEGVIHRDIKSENIIIGDFGEVTVIDWGIAKRISQPASHDSGVVDVSFGKPTQGTGVRETRLGTRLGTPAFMSPEQARGEIASIDERSDVYSLAALLYEILTGDPPFDGNCAESMIEAVLYDQPIHPRQRASFVDERLGDICLRGLARDPEERYHSANLFADTIEAWLDSETSREQTDRSRQKLFDLSTDLMLIFDDTPKIIWVNASWHRLLGWRPEDLAGLKPNFLVHPEDLATDNELFKQLNAGKTVTNIERRIQSSEGAFRWFSWTITPLLDENRTVAVGRDIDGLVRRGDEFAQLLEATPEAIFVVNHDQTIHRVNQRLLKMFGYLEVELIGRSVLVLAPKRSRSTLQVLFENYHSGIEQQTVVQRDQLLGRHKDGRQFPINVRLRRFDSGSESRIVGTVRVVR